MKIRLFMVLLAFAVSCSPIRADSLWKPEKNSSLFTDKKAHQIGDLITILIVETSSASQQADTSVSKKSRADAGPGIGPLLKAIPALSLSGNSDSAAKGSTSRSSTLAAKITVNVVDVKPNGDLVLEGSRNVTANDDTQTLRITGEVRPDDVSPDNTVLSTYVANAKIEYTGRGPISKGNKPGIITRIFKLIF